ncbi:MAG: thioredoxin-disulfide reductase [Bdellovibrionaceae bacterium]|nr:thioredoxin-disulfide reductase [Pseudobdellovibrionaceae bacterium]
MSQVENVIIIGSGPAGLTAAIYASRALLKPFMIEGEEVGGQLMTTTEVENFPGFHHGITGPDLMVEMKKQAERFGTRFLSRNVTKVDTTCRPFKVWVGKDMYESRALIISTGASAKYLGLESERKFLGRGVSACATCDGAFFKNQEVVIVGGGDTAMEEATFLTRFASHVNIIHRRDSFRASKIMVDKALSNPKISVTWDSTIDEIKGDKSVQSIVVRNLKTNAITEKQVSGVFIAIGHKPNTDLFKDVLDMNDVGYLKTKPHSTYTSVEGIFAAGDVADHVYRQAITAAGTGCMAAIDCERWLELQGH